MRWWLDDHARLVAARMCVALDDAARHLLDAINPAAVRFVHPALPPALALGLGVKSSRKSCKRYSDTV